MASSWLNNVTNALESLDQAAETALTTEEERKDVEIALEKRRELAIDEAIERDQKELERRMHEAERNQLQGSVNDVTSSQVARKSYGNAAEDDGIDEDIGHTETEGASAVTSGTYNLSPQALYTQQSIANDLTDDLQVVEVALKRERLGRQKDKEEAEIRAEVLRKANAELTKALTEAERTIEKLREAADSTSIEDIERDALRQVNSAEVDKANREIERLQRDVIKRDVEIENLSTKCKKLQKRFEDTSTLTAEHKERLHSLEREYNQKLKLRQGDFDRLKRHAERVQKELDIYMGKSAMLEERVRQNDRKNQENLTRRRKFEENSSVLNEEEYLEDTIDIEGGYGRNMVSKYSRRRRTKGIASALAPITPLTKNRRVRRAIDQVDRWSLETGRALERYPLARLIFVVYLVTLHFWVFILLGHHSHSMEHNSGGMGHAIPGAMPAAPPPPPQ